jgi:hypothetical protein
MTPDWPRMEDAYASDLAAGNAARKTAPNDLDLRKFRHRSRTGVLMMSERTCSSSSSDDEVGGLQSAIAASGASNQTLDRVPPA